MRYAYLRLQPFYRGYPLTVTSTDPQTLEHIVGEVKRLMPKASVGKANDVSGQIISCRLSRLDGKDKEVFDWIFRWLCERGWEPYGVHANVRTRIASDEIYSIEIHHFRRQI